jgi:hypothetical protein
VAAPASSQRGPKQGTFRSSQHEQPGVETFDRFDGQWRTPFLSTFSLNLQDSMSACRFVISNAQPGEFADATASVGENGEESMIADADGRFWVRCIQETPTIFRRESDGLAIARSRRRLHEVVVCGVGAAVTIDLEVGEKGSQGGQFSTNGTIRQATLLKAVTPGGNIVGPDKCQLFNVIGRATDELDELTNIASIVAPRIGRSGFHQPASMSLSEEFPQTDLRNRHGRHNWH